MRDRVSGQSAHTSPRHVWVCVTGRWDERQPGVLLEWRQAPGPRWEALVVYASGGGNHAWELRNGWVRAEHLKPRD